MAYEAILTDLEDGVFTITLNRPERLNAYNNRMFHDLMAAFDESDANDEIRCVIITGAGRGFCAGADLGGGGKTFDGKVRLDPESLLGHARWVANEVEAFRKLASGLNYLEVFYEDIAADCANVDADGRIQGATALPRVADFLGVPAEFHAPATISKVINRPYSEIIENFDEVMSALKKSEFKKLADTVLQRSNHDRAEQRRHERGHVGRRH